SVATLSLRIAEAGLTLSETAFRTAQSAVEKLTGAQSAPAPGAPPFAPSNLDQAISDLANRTARILYMPPPSREAIPGAIQQWLRAAQTSFQYCDSGDSNRLALALRIPFALGTLLTDAGIRGLKTLEVTGGPRYVEFVKFCFQIFSEFPVYATLE